MPITVGDIVNALEALGGEAHYNDIAQYVVEHGEAPFPQDPAASVRARLQERCSDYQAYKGGVDLFESEAGSGVWRFRGYKPAASVSNKLEEVKRNYSGFDEYEASEGSLVLVEHFKRERDPSLVAKFKRQLSKPVCEVCQFDFGKSYGEAGNGFIEAHHRTPIHKLVEGQKTKIEDLAALCANCHRVLHRNADMTLAQLADLAQSPGRIGADLAEIAERRTTWKSAVLAAIQRRVQATGSTTFARQDLISEELDQIQHDVRANGQTPAQTLSRVLQELRDIGFIEFIVDGEYKILK